MKVYHIQICPSYCSGCVLYHSPLRLIKAQNTRRLVCGVWGSSTATLSHTHLTKCLLPSNERTNECRISMHLGFLPPTTSQQRTASKKNVSLRCLFLCIQKTTRPPTIVHPHFEQRNFCFPLFFFVYGTELLRVIAKRNQTAPPQLSHRTSTHSLYDPFRKRVVWAHPDPDRFITPDETG